MDDETLNESETGETSINYQTDIHKYNAVVFSGGGTKGISFIGAVKYLYDHNILQNITKYVGSSIGAVIALVCCLQYKPDEIFELVDKLELNKLQQIDIDSIMNITTNFGIDSGEKFIKLIKIIIKKKTGNETINFIELYNLTGIELIVTGTCLNNSCVEYFNYINTPEMPVFKAVRISTCFPLYFNSCSLNGKTYVDGALAEYYPVCQCENDKFIGVMINDTSNEKIDVIDDLFVFVNALFYINFKKYKHKLISKYKEQTIVINLSASSIKFDLDKEAKQHYFNTGYKAAEKHFELLKKKSNNDADASADSGAGAGADSGAGAGADADSDAGAGADADADSDAEIKSKIELDPNNKHTQTDLVNVSN